MAGRLTKTILSSQLLDSIQSEYFWGLHIHLQFKFGAQTLKPSITFDWVVEHIHPPPQYEQNVLVKAMRIQILQILQDQDIYEDKYKNTRTQTNTNITCDHVETNVAKTNTKKK